MGAGEAAPATPAARTSAAVSATSRDVTTSAAYGEPPRLARAHGGSAHAANGAGGGVDVWIERPRSNGYVATTTSTTVASPSRTPNAASATTKRGSGAA